MANEQLQIVVDKAADKFSKADLSKFPEKFALQINLTGKIDGVFYVEVLNGKLSVMPYEYIDNDAEICLTKTNFEKILNKKMKLETAIESGKVAVNGDVEKLLLFTTFL